MQFIFGYFIVFCTFAAKNNYPQNTYIIDNQSKIVPNAGLARFSEGVDNAFCTKSLQIRQLTYA